MVKISKSTGQDKHTGPTEESVSKSNPRRKKATKRPSKRAVVDDRDTASANASSNPRQHKSRSREWRYRDMIDLEKQGDDDGCLPEQWELPEQQATEPQPQHAESQPQPERKVLADQGSQYSPDYTDEEEEENERFIETGEHIDEYDDSDLEGVEKLRFEKEEEEPPENEQKQMRDFMRFLRQERGVFVPRLLREIVNTGDSAIVLGQIMYWFDTSRTTGRPRAAIRRYGRNWLFKTHAELGRETGIKPRQVRDCLKFLTAKGFIERRYQRANGMRTTFISLYPRKVYEAMQEVDQKRRETPGATCSVQ